ncbi:MAG: hypothetical protein H6581_28685 [Bacteroidia bacterium]|nr:hypothetical protein [Bacteroidia bacterium]
MGTGIAIAAVVYIFFNLRVMDKIDAARYADESQRKMHKKFIWFVPFLGPLMIRGYWGRRKETKLEITTKKDREVEKGASFYESGKGIHG